MKSMSNKKFTNSNIFTEAFGKALKISALNKAKIAEKTGIQAGRITQYAKGDMEPGLENICKIAKSFKMSASQFIALGESAESVTPPLSSVKMKVIEKIKLLDDTQVSALEPVIQALIQAGAGADNQPGRAKVKPGKRSISIDEPEEIGIIELPGDPIKNNNK